MPRVKSPDMLATIVEGAGRAFARLGYDRAQMAEIAAEAGVGLATLYRYAESKEELFELALRHGFGGPLESLWDASRGAARFEQSVLAFVRASLRFEDHLPLLVEALRSPPPSDPLAELAAVVGELYDGLERNRIPIRMLERSAGDWPALAAVLVEELRTPAILGLAQYLERRCAAGALRVPPDMLASARLIAELCALHAIDRHFSPGGAWTRDATARAVTVDLVVASFRP